MKVSSWSFGLFVVIKVLFCSAVSFSGTGTSGSSSDTDPCGGLANDPNQKTFSLSGFCYVIYQYEREKILYGNEFFCLARRNGTVAIPSAQVIAETDKLINETTYWTSMYRHSNSTCTCENIFLKTNCQATADEINKVCDEADATDEQAEGCVFLSIFEGAEQPTYVYDCDSQTTGVICQYGAADMDYLPCPLSLPTYEYVKQVGTECFFVVRTTQNLYESLISACQAVNSEAQMASYTDIIHPFLFMDMFYADDIWIIATNGEDEYTGYDGPTVNRSFTSDFPVPRAEYPLTACVVSEHVYGG